MSTSQNLALFIFQTTPTDDYWQSIQSFINASLRIPPRHILKYDYASHSKNSTLQYLNISDDPAILFVDMMRRMLSDLRELRTIHFDTTIVYIENTVLSANRTDVSHDLFWFRYFDVIRSEHIVFLYKDVIFFELPLFANKAVYYADRADLTHTEIMIESTNVDISCTARYIIVDNINITEFCDSILTFIKSEHRTLDILQYIIRQTGITRSVLYTNFTLLSTVCFMVRDGSSTHDSLEDMPIAHRYFVLTVYGFDEDDSDDDSDHGGRWNEDHEHTIRYTKPANRTSYTNIRYLEQCYDDIQNHQRNRYFAEC